MEFVIIGKVINTQGIKGEIKIQPLTANLDRFSNLKTAYIGDDKEKVTYERSRVHKHFIIMKLQEYSNINDVLKFKESYIYVDKDDRVELAEDEFFISDLIGSKVFDMGSQEIGIIRDVYEGVCNDAYIIRDNKDNEFMVPAVKEFVKKVDISNKEIFIDPIDGMIP